MWNHKFILLCLILFGAGVVTAPIELLFPVYVEDALGESAWFTARLKAIPILLGGLFALVGGVLSDRFGRRRTLIVGMTGALVAGAVFITRNPLIILGILCYQGVASGFKTAGGQSYLIESVDEDHLGLATAVYFLTMTLSGAIGNAVAGELIERFGYTVVGICIIPLVALLIIAAILFLPNLQGGASEHRRESFVQMLVGYIKMLLRREMWLLLGIRFLPTYFWGTVSLLLPLLIYRLTGVKTVAYYGTLSLLFAALCKILTGRICDAIGHRLPAFVANCLISLIAFGLAFSVNSVILLYVFGILASGIAWSLSTTMPRFINELCRLEEKGRGVGITHLAWSSGFLLGQLIGGYLESVNVALPFGVAGVAVASSAVFAFLLWRSKNENSESL